MLEGCSVTPQVLWTCSPPPGLHCWQGDGTGSWQLHGCLDGLACFSFGLPWVGFGFALISVWFACSILICFRFGFFVRMRGLVLFVALHTYLFAGLLARTRKHSCALTLVCLGPCLVGFQRLHPSLTWPGVVHICFIQRLGVRHLWRPCFFHS